MSHSTQIQVDLRAELGAGQGRQFDGRIVATGLESCRFTTERTSPQQGEMLTLRFNLPDRPAGYEVPVTIAAVSGHHLVTEFEIEDHPGVLALNDWAFAQQNPDGFDHRKTRDVVSACCQIARTFFKTQCDALPQTAKDNLFERAHNATSNDAQAEFMDAMQEVNRIIATGDGRIPYAGR